MFFFDDQMDLETWDQVPTLLALIDKYFGDLVITPPDYYAFPSVSLCVCDWLDCNRDGLLLSPWWPRASGSCSCLALTLAVR